MKSAQENAIMLQLTTKLHHTIVIDGKRGIFIPISIPLESRDRLKKNCVNRHLTPPLYESHIPSTLHINKVAVLCWKNPGNGGVRRVDFV